jgi:predicted outer membrane repeat protein
MYNITNSIFKNNYAGVNGGAIKYTFYPPLISQNNTFINNTAMYGSPIASYPVQMRIANVFYSRQLGFLNTT